jgi:hypothetical protein
MTKPKPTHMGALAALMGSMLLLVACGGGGSDATPMVAAAEPVASAPDVTVSVPTEVATSAIVATNYVAALSSQPESITDVLEPVAVPDQVAQDDTAEPQ